jgi:hypothetical protein
MKTEMDFKALWNKQDTGLAPDTKELLSKAGSIKKRARNKLIVLNLVLLATIAFMLYVGFNIDKILLTTKLGIGLVIIAMLSYLVVYNQIMPMLFKDNWDADSHEYLRELIIIKRKRDFLNKVMINIYFTLLATGMFLYMNQFTVHDSVIGKVLSYGLTFGWIGFSWFYLRPRGVKRKEKPLIETIAKLEELNRQLESGE